MSRQLSGIILATGLVLACGRASAFELDFLGTALPPSGGNVSASEDELYATTSFVGQPVDIRLSISNSPEGLYVDSFNLSWSTLTYSLPYITQFGGGGFPSDGMHDSEDGFLSSVSLTPTGGSIRISPTEAWFADTDGDFDFTLDYVLSSPHPVGSVFSDNGVTGSGRIDAGVEDYGDPIIGEYNADSRVDFSVSGVISAPEPTSWAMLLIGFGAVGGLARARGRDGRARAAL